jgi:hypothetical protein
MSKKKIVKLPRIVRLGELLFLITFFPVVFYFLIYTIAKIYYKQKF